MSVPRDAAYPQNYKTNGSNFIGELWSALMVAKFYPGTYLSEIANTDYEGEIKKRGDTVHISTRPTITISDHEIGDTISYQVPDSDGVDLSIDYAKRFAFKCDNIDKFQSHLPLLEEFATDAAEQMKIAVHRAVVRSVYADVAAANQGATAGKISGTFNLGTVAAPVALTKTNILDYIVDLGTVLDEQDVPDSEGERWLLLPSKACGMIKKSDLKDASIAGDGTSIMRNGRIGMIDRFTIYRDNNLNVAAGKHNIICGHKKGLTFAMQMTDMETLKHPDHFGDFVRGLNVFGFEVINDTALAAGVVTL